MLQSFLKGVAWIVFALAPIVLSAQETRGTIFGRLTDAQDAVVSGATVRVTNVNTNAAITVQTNDTGYYEATFLLPGSYEVTVSKTGFRQSIRGGITLALGARLGVDVRLEVGQTSTSVTVEAESPILEAGHVSGGRTLDTRTIESLPLFYGNSTDLLRFAPGVFSSGVNAQTNNFHALSPGMDTTIAGGVGQNTFSLDGVPNIARSGPSDSTAYQPAQDSVQEMRIETYNFDASIGHTTGVHMAIVTKSGTNQFHGGGSDSMFQQRWNATPFFTKQNYYKQISQAEAAGNHTLAEKYRASQMQPSGHANTYWASLGGPVSIPKVINGKDKLFFFFGYNGVAFRSTESPTSLSHTVPTLSQRSGDFSDLLLVNASRYQLYDPTSVRADPARPGHYIRDPFAGNVIPTSRIVNPAYSAYTKILPTPNNNPGSSTLEPTNNYYAADTPQVYDYKALTNRVDYQLSNRHRFFARWNYNDWYSHRVDWLYSTATGLTESYQYRDNFGGAVNWVFLPSSNTVLDVTVSDNDHVEGNRPTSMALSMKPSAVGLPSYIDDLAGSLAIAPSMIMSGYDTVGPMTNGYPTLVHTRINSAQATLSHIRNHHTLRVGFDARQYYKNQTTGGNTSGNFTFGSTYTQKNDDSYTPAGSLGHSYAAFLLGLPSSASIVRPTGLAMHNMATGWFIQDDFRVTPKLTLNLGMRFEYEWGPTDRYNRMIGAFDKTASLPIAAAAVAAYAASPVAELAASSFAVKGGSLYPGVNGANRALWKSYLMPMPRLGVAYQLNSKTVLRAGYGIFYDNLTAWSVSPSQTGFSSTTTTTPSSDYGMTWTSGTNFMSNPFPVKSNGTRFVAPFGSSMGAMTVAGTGYTYFNPDVDRARQQRWTVAVQRQIGASTMVEVSYVGTYSAHVYVGGGYNDGLSVSLSENALPASYWASGASQTPATANASNLTANVTNPFYIGNFSSLQSSNPALYAYMASNTFFTRTMATKAQLLLPYPHMSGLTESLAPLGKVKTHQLDINLQRRFSKGLSLNASYTKLYNQSAVSFMNSYDTVPTWSEGRMGRPHRFEVTSVEELPFGHGRKWFTNGVPAHLLGGFRLALSYEWQPGPLISFPSVFYSGDVSNIAQGDSIPSRWFNTDGFQKTASLGPQSYQSRVFPLTVPDVRSHSANFWNASIQRDFKIKESLTVHLRAEGLNLFNRSQFAAPNTSPYSTSFGVVTATTASYNRFLQFVAGFRF